MKNKNDLLNETSWKILNPMTHKVSQKILDDITSHDEWWNHEDAVLQISRCLFEVVGDNKYKISKNMILEVFNRIKKLVLLGFQFQGLVQVSFHEIAYKVYFITCADHLIAVCFEFEQNIKSLRVLEGICTIKKINKT